MGHACHVHMFIFLVGNWQEIAWNFQVGWTCSCHVPRKSGVVGGNLSGNLVGISPGNLVLLVGIYRGIGGKNAYQRDDIIINKKKVM